jgi:hypothetical protein
MRKLTLSLLNFLFLPSGSAETYLETAKKARRRDLLKCTVAAFLVLFLLEDGLFIYAAWLTTAAAFGVYQYLWVFSYPVSRPVLYEETSLVFLILVVVNYAAFALLCGAGWASVMLPAVVWIYFSRTMGRFAVAREINKMVNAGCEEYPDEPTQEKAQLAQQMLEVRIADVRSL